MKKIILVNVYYNPNRFGGATIVVEELAKWLNILGWQVLIVTSHDSPITMYRYKVNNIDVVSINQRNDDITNINFGNEYKKVLKSFNPDIVHFHSIQTMGVNMMDITSEMNIPFITTLHDHWWKCNKQFMIANDGRYCFQEKIDLDVCKKKCGIDKLDGEMQNNLLFQVLHKSDNILVPSQYFKDFYVDNSFDSRKLKVNKNGVKMPRDGYQKVKSKDGLVRFGFVGGPGPIKGLDLIVKAMEKIDNTNYELILVDAAKNINSSWYSSLPKISGKITVVDPYNQDTIDDFFSTIDVLLFPSQWKESFGLTVREALLRDVWVISTNGGGTIEDLRDGENSRIIEIGDDPHQLREAIIECLNKNDWDSYTNEFKSDITTFEQQARQLEKICEKVIVKTQKQKTVIFHIGRPKTGSKALQHFLYDNKEALKEQGYLYPETVSSDKIHHSLAWSVANVNTDLLDGDAEFYYDLFIDEFIESGCKTAIVSSEDTTMYTSPQFCRNIKEYLEGFNIRILVYLRRQDDAIVSSYNQSVKLSDDLYEETIEEYIKITPTFNYNEFLSVWADVFGKENIIVRPYDDYQMKDGVVNDFLDFFNIDKSKMEINTEKVNTSLDRDALEIVRCLNQVMVSIGEVDKTFRYVLMRKVEECIKNLEKEGVSLSYADVLGVEGRKQILLKYSDSNADIAEEYLKRDYLFVEEIDEKYSEKYKGLSQEVSQKVCDYLDENTEIDNETLSVLKKILDYEFLG